LGKGHTPTEPIRHWEKLTEFQAYWEKGGGGFTSGEKKKKTTKEGNLPAEGLE